jgi:hypothetical protein
MPKVVGWPHITGQKPEINDGQETEEESIDCGKETGLKDEDNDLEQSPWTTQEEKANATEKIKRTQKEQDGTEISIFKFTKNKEKKK